MLKNLISHFTGSAQPDPLLQFRNHSNKTEDIVVGVDFGTASTRVVLQSRGVGGGHAFAVPLANSSDRLYLLRSLVRRKEDRFSLDTEGEPIGELKVRLMLEPESPTALRDATAFLSAAIRRARRWFLDKQKHTFGSYQLRWHMNLGIPSAGYDDLRIRAAFGRAARAAWNLSQAGESPSVEDVDAALDSGTAPGHDPVIVDVVPEVAAEVVAYARSKQKRDDLHLMVDVGATTLDLCGFNLRTFDHEDRYFLLTAAVEPLGSAVLHKQRLQILRRLGLPTKHPLQVLDVRDPFVCVPEHFREYLENPGDEIRDDVRQLDSQFHELCQRTVRSVLADLYMRRYPMSPRWNRSKEPLPVFLCGGGARMVFYQEVLEQVRKTRNSAAWSHFEVRVPPRPERLLPVTIASELIPRLLVAYGLSFSVLDIGELEPPHAIADAVDPLPKKQLPPYIGKEFV